MKEYTIINLIDERYKALVFYNAFVTSKSYLKLVSKDLRDKNITKGNILFDMILVMGRGNNDERYTEVFFDGKDLIESTFKYVNISKKDKLRKLSMEYMRDNQKEILTHSLLSSIKKKMISKGIVI